MPFFDQNRGLTPLENIQKCDYPKCKFLRLKTILLCRKDPQTLFQDVFCPKTENVKSAMF